MSDTATIPRLDVTTPQKVTYCIPLWLRDEQVRVNTAKVKGRIEEGALQTEPCAVVCFGPSLNDTWESLRDFRYIITCSGAHKFLIDRGIIPTWHLDVDPRLHKTLLLGTPHKDVTYLPASTCHPGYLDVLINAGVTIKLWHVFDATEDAIRVLPQGEWALTGGSSAGLRCLTMARFLGFTDLHIFGMDGCEGPSGKHAAEHPSQPAGYALTEYKGVEYRTTSSLLECARQTFHELNQLKDVTATFHGTGLVQEMAKDWTPERPKGSTAIGIHKDVLISEQYRDLNARLHEDNLAYGVGGGRHAPVVLKLAESLKTTRVLDYGCGKGYLAKALPFPIWEYDPAIPTKAEPPRPADIVVCADVLEHIEPDHLPAVLGDLARCVRQIGYFVIHTGPAAKTLPDGRNTHLIQEKADWWRERLSAHFTIGQIAERGLELHCVVGPRVVKKKKKR